MDGGGGRRRTTAKSSAEDVALDQIAREVMYFHFVLTAVKIISLVKNYYVWCKYENFCFILLCLLRCYMLHYHSFCLKNSRF